MSEILFSYDRTATYGRRGGRSGTGVAVMTDGEVLCRRFTFGEDAPSMEEPVGVHPGLAQEIRAILDAHADALLALPEKLYNGSCDGSFDRFRFGDKRVQALNISRGDPEETRQRNPRYYQRYSENMQWENAVLEIYDPIRQAIGRYEPLLLDAAWLRAFP